MLNSPKSKTAILITVSIAVAAIAAAILFHERREESDVPAKVDLMNYVSDITLALCDLNMTYGESAAEHSQFYECGDSYIISVYTDPVSKENHYRVYFDWGSANYWAPHVFHYINFDILSAKKNDSGNWVYRVEASDYLFENYLFDPEDCAVEHGPEFSMETDKYGRPVKIYDIYQESPLLNCLTTYMSITQDCELTYRGSHIDSINALQGNSAAGTSLRKFAYIRKNRQLEVTESAQNLPASQVASVSYDSKGNKESVTRPYIYPITAYSFDDLGRTMSVSYADGDYVLENWSEKAICTIEYSYKYGFPVVISKTYTNNTTGKTLESETYNEDGYLIYRGKWNRDGKYPETEEFVDYIYDNNTFTVNWTLTAFGSSGSTIDSITYDLSGRPLSSYYKFDPGDGSVPAVKSDEYRQYDDINRIATSLISGDTLDYFEVHENPYYLRAIRLYELGNYYDAIRFLDTIINDSGSSAKYRLLRGKAWYALYLENNDSSCLSNADADFDAVLRTDDAESKVMISNYYLEIADNYLRSGMNDRAKEYILKSNEITPSDKTQKRINAISSNGTWEDENGQAFDVYGNLIKRTHYDENGNLKWYQTFTYDERNCCDRMTSYDANGIVTAEYTDFTYDNFGNEIKGFVYSIETGKPVKYSISSYRDNDSVIESIYYYIGTDKYAGKAVYSYDEVYKRNTGYTIFDENNRRTIYSIYDFNSRGEMIGLSLYNDNGSYIGYESEDN